METALDLNEKFEKYFHDFKEYDRRTDVSVAGDNTFERTRIFICCLKCGELSYIDL